MKTTIHLVFFALFAALAPPARSSGAPAAPKGVEEAKSLGELEQWLETLRDVSVAEYEKILEARHAFRKARKYSPDDTEFNDMIGRVGDRARSLCTARFIKAAENRDIEEASGIFSWFGPSEDQAKLGEILGKCEDKEFVARVILRELTPSTWPGHALVFRARGEICRKTLPKLYYGLLGEELPTWDEPEKMVPIRSTRDEDYRPFRKRLLEKFPALAEAAPPTAPGEPAPASGAARQPPVRPAAAPPAPDKTPPPGAPPRATSLPRLPLCLAAGLLAALAGWLAMKKRAPSEPGN